MRKNKNTDRNDRYRRTIFYWFSGISLFISIVALCGAYVSKNMVVEDESIVLIFVGILATFVVVGNYAQVKSIEQDFSEKVGELKFDFSEKVKELKHEFDKKVLFNQTLSIMQELYKKMDDAVRIAEGLIPQPYSKRKEMIEEGKENTNTFINFLNINRLILPSALYSLFKEIEELLSDCFNNSAYTLSTSENNIAAEERIFANLNNAVLKDIPGIRRKIDELLIKYLRNE